MASRRGSDAEIADRERTGDSARASTPTDPTEPNELGSGDAHAPGFYVVTHDSLFEPAHDERCDACGESIGTEDDESDAGVTGAGAYLRARGDDVQIERVPLCAACASAIGLTALARWEIEEEEG
jgi:hypothetical protein